MQLCLFVVRISVLMMSAVLVASGSRVGEMRAKFQQGGSADLAWMDRSAMRAGEARALRSISYDRTQGPLGSNIETPDASTVVPVGFVRMQIDALTNGRGALSGGSLEQRTAALSRVERVQQIAAAAKVMVEATAERAAESTESPSEKFSTTLATTAHKNRTELEAPDLLMPSALADEGQIAAAPLVDALTKLEVAARERRSLGILVSLTDEVDAGIDALAMQVVAGLQPEDKAALLAVAQQEAEAASALEAKAQAWVAQKARGERFESREYVTEAAFMQAAKKARSFTSGIARLRKETGARRKEVQRDAAFIATAKKSQTAGADMAASLATKSAAAAKEAAEKEAEAQRLEEEMRKQQELQAKEQEAVRLAVQQKAEEVHKAEQAAAAAAEGAAKQALAQELELQKQLAHEQQLRQDALAAEAKKAEEQQKAHAEKVARVRTLLAEKNAKIAAEKAQREADARELAEAEAKKQDRSAMLARLKERKARREQEALLAAQEQQKEADEAARMQKEEEAEQARLETEKEALRVAAEEKAAAAKKAQEQAQALADAAAKAQAEKDAALKAELAALAQKRLDDAATVIQRIQRSRQARQAYTQALAAKQQEETLAASEAEPTSATEVTPSALVDSTGGSGKIASPAGATGGTQDALEIDVDDDTLFSDAKAVSAGSLVAGDKPMVPTTIGDTNASDGDDVLLVAYLFQDAVHPQLERLERYIKEFEKEGASHAVAIDLAFAWLAYELNGGLARFKGLSLTAQQAELERAFKSLPASVKADLEAAAVSQRQEAAARAQDTAELVAAKQARLKEVVAELQLCDQELVGGGAVLGDRDLDGDGAEAAVKQAQKDQVTKMQAIHEQVVPATVSFTGPRKNDRGEESPFVGGSIMDGSSNPRELFERAVAWVKTKTLTSEEQARVDEFVKRGYEEALARLNAVHRWSEMPTSVIAYAALAQVQNLLVKEKEMLYDSLASLPGFIEGLSSSARSAFESARQQAAGAWAYTKQAASAMRAGVGAYVPDSVKRGTQAVASRVGGLMSSAWQWGKSKVTS